VTAFAAVYIIWGSTYLGIKLAIDSVPPLLMAAARFGLAGTLLYAWARWKGAPRPAPAIWGRAAIVGACLLVFGNGGLTFAELYVPTGLASLLIALVPLFMALMGWFSGQSPRPTGRVWLSLGTGLVGVALLVNPSGDPSARHPHFFFGVMVVLLSGLVWSIGSLYSRHAGRGTDPALMAGMQMLAASAMLFPCALLRGEFQSFHLAQVTLTSAIAYLYLVFIGAIVGYSAYLWLLRHCPPSQVATYAYVNPVVAILLGVGFAGEKFTPSMATGAALILAAVALVITKRQAAEPVRSPQIPLTETTHPSSAQ
jgi:drug/metabolite transporter (DMT)-like permease